MLRGGTGVIPCGCCATVSTEAVTARLRPMHDQHAIGGARRATTTIDIASAARKRRQDADGLRKYFGDHQSGGAACDRSRSHQAAGAGDPDTADAADAENTATGNA